MNKIEYLPNSRTRQSNVRDYFTLLKPRVISLVVFTAIAGIVLAPGHLHPAISIISLICIALGSGAAGAFNMWYDRDIDSLMKRTKNRPIVRGIITPGEALDFAIVTSFLSLLIMAICVNYLAAFLLLVAIVYYAYIYTVLLKRFSYHNIVIGGGAGAFPPLIGWASVTNSIDIQPVILFLIIFFWTPPHFWALSLYKSEDYKLAKVPMLPLVKGKEYTKKQILIYTYITIFFSLLPYFINLCSGLYLASAIILGAIFIYFAIQLQSKEEYAPKMFGYSILYLFLLFGIMIIDKIIH